MTDRRHLDQAISAYLRILERVGERATSIGPAPVASHWPHVGSRFGSGGLLVVGQALDGWDAEVTEARWPAQQARTVEGREHILAATRAWHADASEPIWEIVRSGKRRGSPFWQIAARLTEELVPDLGSPWWSRLAWANTYPLGHERWMGVRASSPLGSLKEAQDPLVGELLVGLVEHLNPGYIAVISGGKYWWGVRQQALPPFEEREFPLVASQRVADRSWVVGVHPRATRQRHIRDVEYAAMLADELRRR